MAKVFPLRIILTGVLLLAACTGGPAEQAAQDPTATLAPIISMTPRFTATPVATRTPLPTFTFTPSVTPIPPTPSDTPTPTEPPPIVGIVASLDRINVRSGPGVSFSAFVALAPGTRVIVLGQNPDGNWLNIQLENGDEGWVSSTLISIQQPPTPIPTATPSPDLTALALGTPLPTALFGGGTVTPTPPRSVVSPTPVTATTEGGATPTPFLPVIDVTAINLTATALTGGIIAPTATPTRGAPAGATTTGAVPTTPAGPGPTATLQAGVGGAGSVSAQEGVDVLAYCNDLSYGRPAPTNLEAGATIDVWWGWFAKTEAQIQDHLANVIYEVAIDGVRIQNWQLYRGPIRLEGDGNYHVYWYVPAGPLAAGQHQITYSVSWRAPISDGYEDFGPGTANPIQTGRCDFVVR